MTQEKFNELVEEFKGMSEKTESLRNFILDEEKFNEFDLLNRDLLILQLKTMESYLSVLSIRLGINGQEQLRNMTDEASDEAKPSEDAE